MINVNFQIPLGVHIHTNTYINTYWQTVCSLDNLSSRSHFFYVHFPPPSALCPYGSCQRPLTPDICSPVIMCTSSSRPFTVWLPLCPHGTNLPTALPTGLEWGVPTWSPHSQGEMMADSLCRGGSQPSPDGNKAIPAQAEGGSPPGSRALLGSISSLTASWR